MALYAVFGVGFGLKQRLDVFLIVFYVIPFVEVLVDLLTRAAALLSIAAQVTTLLHEGLVCVPLHVNTSLVASILFTALKEPNTFSAAIVAAHTTTRAVEAVGADVRPMALSSRTPGRLIES
jgi:hypothetical protein